MIESPKLFLTPSEVNSNSNEVRMAFDKFDHQVSFNIVYLDYKRVNIKNSIYPYVYVHKDSIDIFNSIYFRDQNNPQNKNEFPKFVNYKEHLFSKVYKQINHIIQSLKLSFTKG